MTDQPMARPLSARPRNGLGVAALVLGVASLVAAISFVLFPLGGLGGLIALILGVIALSRGRTSGATNSGQAWAGTICGLLALVIGHRVRGARGNVRRAQLRRLHQLRQLHRQGRQPR